jgi:hypothetical protein
MDPEAAWDLLVQAIIDKDCQEARFIAIDLLNWLNMGGFPPSISLFRVSKEWQSLLCRKVCETILSSPTELWNSNHDE